MNSTQVLSDSGFIINESELPEHFPHLTDKMVVDLVNGIEVANDHIKVSKSRTSKGARLLDSLSGKGKQRHDLINENLAKGLESASHWLQNHDYELASVNISITKIGARLLEVRQGVMALQSKHERLASSVQGLADVVETKTKQLHDYVQDVDYRTRAERQLDRIFDKWKAGRLNHFELYPRVYTVLDLLRNGDFGFYLNSGVSEKEYKQDMLAHLHDKMRSQVCGELKIEATDLLAQSYRMNVKDMYGSLCHLKVADLHALNYLSDWGDMDLHLNTWCVNQLTESHIRDEDLLSKVSLPKSVRVDRWLDRITEENLGFQAVVR